MTYISLANFFPWAFIAYGAIINKVVSLISFSDCSLPVFRSTVNFWTLILYIAALLSLFILEVFLWIVDSLEISI